MMLYSLHDVHSVRILTGRLGVSQLAGLQKVMVIVHAWQPSLLIVNVASVLRNSNVQPVHNMFTICFKCELKAWDLIRQQLLFSCRIHNKLIPVPIHPSPHPPSHLPLRRSEGCRRTNRPSPGITYFYKQGYSSCYPSLLWELHRLHLL